MRTVSLKPPHFPGACLTLYNRDRSHHMIAGKDPMISRPAPSVMNFEAIERIGDLETVSEESAWQNFERLAGFIFEKNEFAVNVNTVKTQNRKRRQYDVIGRFSLNARNGRAAVTGYQH